MQAVEDDRHRSICQALISDPDQREQLLNAIPSGENLLLAVFQGADISGLPNAGNLHRPFPNLDGWANHLQVQYGIPVQEARNLVAATLKGYRSFHNCLRNNNHV